MKTPLMLIALAAALLLGTPRLLAQEADPPTDCPQPENCQCDGDACTPDPDCPNQDGDAKRRRNRKKSGANRQKGSRGGGKKARREGKGKGKGQQGKRGRARRRQGGADGTCGGACFALANVESDGTQTVSDDYLARLQGALETELFARDYYQAASTALGGVAPFDRLADAEQRHADAVKNMIRIVGGVAVPEHSTEIVAPTSLEQAEAECEAIELYVIDLYTKLIEDCTDDRILGALRAIQAANHRHLAAVEN